MKEPRRLLADAETSDFSRVLLEAGRARRPSRDARDRVWTAVGASVAGGAGLGLAAGASGGTKGGVALLAGKLKLFALTCTVSAAVVGAAVVATGTRHRELLDTTFEGTDRTPAKSVESRGAPSVVDEQVVDEQPGAVAAGTAPPLEEPAALAADTSVSVPAVPAAVDVPSSRVAARRAPVAIAPEAAAAPAAQDASESATPRSDAPNGLREEATLLRDARAALKRGDPVAAGALLADAERRFPAGRLAQEREALTVRVASASGERGRAILLARTFVEKYPDSPLRASMQTLARGDEIQ